MNKIGLLLALSIASLGSLANANSAHQATRDVGAQVAKGNHFAVDSSQADCKAGAECVVELKLSAEGGFHVNKEYPYKFKAGDVAGVDYTGTDTAGKNVFSKASGDFTPDAKDEKLGTMKVHFKAAKAGALAIPGTFKLSVCSAENCQLETAELSIPVTIK